MSLSRDYKSNIENIYECVKIKRDVAAIDEHDVLDFA